jgi:hypothetical protein
VLTGLWFYLIERPVQTVEEIPIAIEILIPTRKIYEGYSLLYLENERLGISQSPPPILWKKRAQCVIKR